MSQAPNYDGEWPRAGERIGPTWQAIWDDLENGKWKTGKQLAHKHNVLVVPDTVFHILKKAYDAGVLERATRAKPNNPKLTYYTYKRTDEGVKKDV